MSFLWQACWKSRKYTQSTLSNKNFKKIKQNFGKMFKKLSIKSVDWHFRNFPGFSNRSYFSDLFSWLPFPRLRIPIGSNRAPNFASLSSVPEPKFPEIFGKLLTTIIEIFRLKWGERSRTQSGKPLRCFENLHCKLKVLFLKHQVYRDLPFLNCVVILTDSVLTFICLLTIWIVTLHWAS